MKQLELRRQMSHLFEHDQLFCLNEKQIKLKRAGDGEQGRKKSDADGTLPRILSHFELTSSF